jgi:hypothetical protein
MRNLDTLEIESVAGGDLLTIFLEATEFIHAGPAYATLVGGAFTVGYGIGSIWNEGIQAMSQWGCFSPPQ